MDAHRSWQSCFQLQLLNMPNYSSSRGIYGRPLFVILRLEALWSVDIAHARFITNCLTRFIKKIPKMPKHDYVPSYGGKGGYEARLISMSIEDSFKKPEIEGPYPDW